MTQEQTGTPPQADFDAQRLREAPLLMRRSRTDRRIAGVCGGFAAYARIDPVVVRVVIAALAVTGAGLVLYLAAWILVPEEGSDAAAVDTRHSSNRDEVRRIGWIVAGVLALVALISAGPFFDVWFPWPLVVLGVLGWLWFARDRSPADAPPVATGAPTYAGTTAAPTYAGATATPTYASTTSESPTYASTTTESPTYAGTTTESPTYAGTTGSPPPGASAQPPPGRPTRSPRSRRGDNSLSLLITGLALVVLGVLWAVDRSITDLDVPAYLAAVLAVVGLGLLVGAVIGDGRRLVPAAVLLGLALLLSSQVTVWRAGEIEQAPRSASQLLDSYELGAGRVWLDLTRIEDLTGLDGRTLTIDVSTGEVVVLVPDEVDLTVSASQLAGEIRVLGSRDEGLRNDVDVAEPDTAGPDLELVINSVAGRVEVSGA